MKTSNAIADRRISLEDIPRLMIYLKVSEDDDEFIDNCCDKLQLLCYSDKYLKEGLLFRELIDVLVDVGFMQGFELTEKECQSVHCAQMLISILLAANVFGEKARSKAKREKFAHVVRDCNDIANEHGPFKDRRIYAETRLLVYKY